MADKHRASWLDQSGDSVAIDDYARELGSFLDAMADGVVEKKELAAAEARVVSLMKEVEPLLDDATHAKVTRLLVELSALSTMQTLHTIEESRVRSLVL
jgi:hypothetical protein